MSKVDIKYVKARTAGIGDWLMTERIKNLSLFRKIFLFSFIICFAVVISTVGISLLIQTKQMETQLKFRVVEMATLWSETINAEDVKIVKTEGSKSNESYRKLVEQLSIVEEKAPYSSAFLLAPEILPNDNVFILVSTTSFEDVGLQSFSYIEAKYSFLKGYLEAIDTKKVTSSQLYKGKFGSRIFSFVPILDNNGNVVAVLSININAAVLENYQKSIVFYLIVSILIISLIMYQILRRGLKKVLEPVNDIIYGLTEVSKGNFKVKLQSTNQPELRGLIDNFNNMTNQLSELFGRLSTTSEHLGMVNRHVEPIHRFEDAIDEMGQILEKTKLQRELQRAEKMNAIGQLAASVAHEIRNPMTVVKGFLQIFLAKEEMSEEERMYIRLMLEEMTRAETIINDYLSLAKPDMEQAEVVDAGELAAKVMDLMYSYAMMSKNIQIRSDLQHNIFITGNKGELTQVLINIFKNGIEAMKDGGVLSLSVYKEKEFAVFKIADTGVGMDEQELERLGMAFYSLKEKGTGIGLMVCFQIIERMKGKIEVDSQKGEGTIFRVYLPLIED